MKCIIILSILILPVIVYAEDEMSQADQLSSIVAFLQGEIQKTVTKDDKEYEIFIKQKCTSDYLPLTDKISGTGFLVANGDLLYLVTAGHVAKGIKSKDIVTLKTTNDKPISFELKEFLQRDNLDWAFSEKADVAVLRLNPSNKVQPHLGEHFLEMQMLEDKLESVSRDEPILTIGFPLGLGIQEYFSPISKESKASSGLIVLDRFDNQKKATFILLDSPSVGGFSGAPVFKMPSLISRGNKITISNKIVCIGLIHGTISDETGGKFAAVVSAHFIRELIQGNGGR